MYAKYLFWCLIIVIAGTILSFGTENLYYYRVTPKENNPHIECDICVYGATSAGITAAIQAARMGKNVVLLAFGTHIGGLTSGGLNRTDGGSEDVTGGLAREFYNKAGESGFSASSAEKIFNDMLAAENVPIYYECHLLDVLKNGNEITEIRMENGTAVSARMFIDATYEGDLMAMAGVSYATGRESNSVYNETYNGQWTGGGHNFRFHVDPYVVEGDSASGLLWGISSDISDPEKDKGKGDKRIQAYCFRMHLTKNSDKLPFPKPEGYDRKKYLLLLRYLKMGARPQFRFGHDTNNHHFVDGAFFTDNVGNNYEWPDGPGDGEASYPKDQVYAQTLYQMRENIFQEHVTYQQGVMWFLANDPEVPESVRSEVQRWGLPNDEYVTTGGWTHELYIREGRRMVSDLVVTEHHCKGTEIVQDPIALGEYNMDSHHCQRVVVRDDGEAYVTNEGNAEIRSKKGYEIPFRAIVPRESECRNVLVTCAVSASHIAYGSIRMEPVFMSIGQSAAAAASIAIDRGVAIQKVPYPALYNTLLEAGQLLGEAAAICKSDVFKIYNRKNSTHTPIMVNFTKKHSVVYGYTLSGKKVFSIRQIAPQLFIKAPATDQK